LLSLWRTSVGKKVVMAITGFILYAFVVGHMLGNLKIYAGPEKYNAYGLFLREVGAPAVPHAGLLWLARAVLIVSVVLHVLAAVQLWLSSRAARPVGYDLKKDIAAGYSVATMRWGGIFLALFTAFHLLHFTVGAVGYDGSRTFLPGDIYHNVVTGFSVWYVSAFYILAMLALGLHLYHGVWSMFQTLGVNDSRNNRAFKALAVLSAVIVAGGNISFPVAVLTGAIR
jgi:succinate dehydrogenase / fumarate reductase, cytochrome b subunit